MCNSNWSACLKCSSSNDNNNTNNNWVPLQLQKLPGGLPHGFPGPIHIKVTLFGVIVISTYTGINKTDPYKNTNLAELNWT